jgi:TRAP-type C4-dicarboxylate transport system substrate-binding protein
LFGLASGPAEAGITVKLATLAPDGSIWDQAVEEMGATWTEDTQGRVSLRVYPGGVAGDEQDVVRKMRIGQLQAAVLTVGGLVDLDESFRLFTIPFFFQSYDELYSVLDELTPLLRQRLEAKGYVLLGWGHAGWIHLFSKEPVAAIDTMKKTKFFVSAGDDRMVQWWKDRGYRPVPLSSTDILTGLQTGMIEALPSPPLAALMLQWYRSAPNMLDLGFAPLVGATVIQAKVWNRIAEGDQVKLRAGAQDMETHLKKEVPRQDKDAIAAMEKRGLKVVKVQATAQEAQWQEAAKAFAADVQSSWVPPEILQAALKARDKYRQAHKAAGAGS